MCRSWCIPIPRLGVGIDGWECSRCNILKILTTTTDFWWMSIDASRNQIVRIIKTVVLNVTVRKSRYVNHIIGIWLRKHIENHLFLRNRATINSRFNLVFRDKRSGRFCQICQIKQVIFWICANAVDKDKAKYV